MSDIWRLQSQFDNEGLIRALAHESADIRRRAAVALRTIGAAEAVPALRQALSQESDPQVRAALLAALETLSEEDELAEPAPASAEAAIIPPTEAAPAPATAEANAQAVNVLLRQLESHHPDEVVAAALRLGEMGDKTAAEPLVVLFTNPRTSGEIKLAVAEALLKLNSAPVEVALLASLRHTHPDVRRKGAAILGHLKAEWAVIPLGEALRDPVQIVRRTARAALKNIGTPEARKILARFGTEQLRRLSNDELPEVHDESADAPTLMNRPSGMPKAASGMPGLTPKPTSPLGQPDSDSSTPGDDSKPT